MLIYEKVFKIEKNLAKQLNFIYGVSDNKAHIICALLGLKKYEKLSNILTLVKKELPLIITKIIDIDKKYFVEDNLKHQNVLIRKNLKLLGNYKSLRYNQYLPANGQRTHTNAKTQKKRRK